MSYMDNLGRQVSPGEVEFWFTKSAELASTITKQISANLWSPAVVLLLAETNSNHIPLLPLDEGRGLSKSGSVRVATNLLRRMFLYGCKTLIVEDDLRRSSIKGVKASRLGHGDRVFNWVELEHTGESASTLLHLGSSEYPLNAFVCSKSSGELGFSNESDLKDYMISRINDSIQAVFVSCFDAEAYLVWLKPDIV